MSDNSQVPGGDDQDAAGGGSGNETPDNSNDSKPKGDTVSREAYDRLLDEKKSFAKRLKELEDGAKKKTEEELRAKEDWKKIAESRDAEIAELKSNLESLTGKISEYETREVTTKKFRAFLKSLDGKIEDKSLSLVPIDMITVNPETGEVDEMSVNKAVKQFKAEWPELIKTGTGVKLPNDAPRTDGNSTGKMTFEAYKALPPDEMMKVKMTDIIDL